MNRIDQSRPDCPPLGTYGLWPIGVQTQTFVNPGQPDTQGPKGAVKDRRLVVELWYPAPEGSPQGGTYDTILRDGITPARLHGRAGRDLPPSPGPFPLVILSHGYPGNRVLMSPLAERLASQGYVVAAIDHPGSTYDDQVQIADTLLHRPLDQAFVLNALADQPFIDADLTSVIGYSMGGYGALIFGGAGLTAATVVHEIAPRDGLLARHQAGAADLQALVDPRVKAMVTFGPYGRNMDMWDAAGLAGCAKPLLVIAGSQDGISGYEAMRSIWAETSGTPRHLLTFENAGHNAGAPMPAPAESHIFSERLNEYVFDHYGDLVWDTIRMNDIAAHVVTGFLDRQIKGKGAGPTLPALAPGLTLETLA